VFHVLPTEVKGTIPPDLFKTASSDALAAVSIIHNLAENESLSPHPALSSLTKDLAIRARFYLAGLLLPYLGLNYQDKKGKSQCTVAAVIRESLKLGTQNHYLDGIPALFTGTQILKTGMKEHQHKSMDRVRLGLLLRNKSIHNPFVGIHWSTSILFSLVTDLVPHYSVKDDGFHCVYSNDKLFWRSY